MPAYISPASTSEFCNLGKNAQSAHPSKISTEHTSEQNLLSEAGSVPSHQCCDKALSYDGRLPTTENSAVSMRFGNVLTEDVKGHDNEQMPITMEVLGMPKPLLNLTKELFREDLDVLSPVELLTGSMESPAILEPQRQPETRGQPRAKSPRGDPRLKSGRIVNKSLRQLADRGEGAAPTSAAVSEDGRSSQGPSSPPVVARAAPSHMPPMTNLVHRSRSCPPPGLEFMQAWLERASAKQRTSTPGLQMGREGPPDMWPAEKPRSKTSGGFCGAPPAQDEVVEMGEAFDADGASDVELDSDADAEPTVVMVGPSYLASNPHVLQEVALPDHFGSVLIRSSSHQVVLSDATRRGQGPQGAGLLRVGRPRRLWCPAVVQAVHV